jgi:sarcosine oxidase
MVIPAEPRDTAKPSCARAMPLYEVIVVGLGAVGSAATWHLARLGTKVLGIDRYKPPHEFGSSTGETRLTRAAVGEGVEYSPLALRSNEIWREIETTTSETLFVQCGCLTITGHPNKSMEGCRLSPNLRAPPGFTQLTHVQRR